MIQLCSCLHLLWRHPLLVRAEPQLFILGRKRGEESIPFL